MGEMMMKIVEPLVIEKERKAKEEGKILGAVETSKEFGKSQEEAAEHIMRKYQLSREKVAEYLKEYW